MKGQRFGEPRPFHSIQVVGNDIFRGFVDSRTDTALGLAKVRVLHSFRGGNAKRSGELRLTA